MIQHRRLMPGAVRRTALCLGILFVAFAVPLFGAENANPSPITLASLLAEPIGLSLTCALIVAMGWLVGRTPRRALLGILIAAAGAAAGFGVAVSRESLAGMAAPTLLGFFGLLYFRKPYRPYAGRAAAAFAIPMIAGSFLGASLCRDAPLWFRLEQGLPAILIAFAGIAVFGIWGSKRRDDPYLVLAAAAVGAFVGLATGASTDPIVQSVASSVLGFSGGLLAAALAEDDEQRRTLASAVVGFGVLLVLCVYFGAVARILPDAGDTPLAWWGGERNVLLFGSLLVGTALAGWTIGTAANRVRTYFGFAFLGSAIGFVVGLSRTAVLSGLINPALVLLAGATALALKSSTDERRALRAVSGIFLAMLLLGGGIGYGLQSLHSGERDALEMLEHSLEEANLQVQKLERIVADAESTSALSESLSDALKVQAELAVLFEDASGFVERLDSTVHTEAPKVDCDVELQILLLRPLVHPIKLTDTKAKAEIPLEFPPGIPASFFRALTRFQVEWEESDDGAFALFGWVVCTEEESGKRSLGWPPLPLPVSTPSIVGTHRSLSTRLSIDRIEGGGDD